MKAQIGIVAATLVLFSLFAIPAYSRSQEADVTGGFVPGDDAVGPVGIVDAEYKFDAGLYAKVLDLVQEDPQGGDPGVFDGVRYYNVIMVVSRDDGDGRGPEETAQENKDSIVRRLNLLGARDILAAESLSFVTASIPVVEIPGFALDNSIYRMGDGEEEVRVFVDTARQTIRATDDNIRTPIGKVHGGTHVFWITASDGIDTVREPYAVAVP
ncbi:hypothetical protein CENSYa_0536 [Cenarchaeum symbiosum A]|uniref:Uncharacterized protein n=1 Tax=Cenarchaeum symbiosum (strain A) TaxID=414004 RepID=A0RV02_CENSY|nr:hypothetical protein CENSYa_0536 [Cenarchaeum symbiosum A]